MDNNILIGEEWKLAPFYEYESIWVSSYGRLIKEDGFITLGNKQGGYLVISLRKQEGGKNNIRVHRLVIATFIGRNDELMVNHKDGDKQNNRLDNLEYTTNRENVQHAVNNGLRKYENNNLYSVKINQFDIRGNFIAQYDSMTEAAKNNNLDLSSICKVCKGKQGTTGGYRWTYA